MTDHAKTASAIAAEMAERANMLDAVEARLVKSLMRDAIGDGLDSARVLRKLDALLRVDALRRHTPHDGRL